MHKTAIFLRFGPKKSISERFCSPGRRISVLFWPIISPFSTNFDIFLAIPMFFSHLAGSVPLGFPLFFSRMMLFFGLNCDLDLVLCSKTFSADLLASHCCVRGCLFYSKADPAGILRMPSFSIREIKVVRFIPKISAAPPLPDILPPQWASTSSM